MKRVLRALIPLKFTDTGCWIKHQVLIKPLTERNDRTQMQFLSDFQEFIHTKRGKGH